MDVFPEVQRQEAAASSESPVRAAENSLGQARGRSPSRRPGSAFPPFLLSPRIARLGAIRGERLGEGGGSLPIDESRVSLFSKCLSARSVIFANEHGLPPSPLPSPPKTSTSWRSLGEREKPAVIWTQGGVRSSYSALCPGLMSVALSGRSIEDAAPAASLFLEKCPISNVPPLSKGGL